MQPNAPLVLCAKAGGGLTLQARAPEATKTLEWPLRSACRAPNAELTGTRRQGGPAWWQKMSTAICCQAGLPCRSGSG